MKSLPRLDRYWYSRNLVALSLWPLSWLFALAVSVRRYWYQHFLRPTRKAAAPVVVVGNLTVGGSGKTPLIIYLVDLLRDNGYRPGIVSRGYGGRAEDWPCEVYSGSDPREVGDEPVLLAQRCHCPVVVGPDRPAAVERLLTGGKCDVVLSDDGLQHYAMARDIEIAVIDGVRRFGNGACLPAGPLREPQRRLRSVDFIVNNGRRRDGEYTMQLHGETAISLNDPDLTCSLAVFSGSLVHAVAGIGDPDRFFHYLKDRGIRVLPHPFPDHYPFVPQDLRFGDDLPVLMTEKDAVKCRLLSTERYWYVPVQATLDASFEQALLLQLERCFGNRAAARI